MIAFRMNHRAEQEVVVHSPILAWAEEDWENTIGRFFRLVSRPPDEVKSTYEVAGPLVWPTMSCGFFPLSPQWRAVGPCRSSTSTL